MGEIRDIGIDVATPTGEWDGVKTVLSMGAGVRGQIIEGKIVSAEGMDSSVVLEKGNNSVHEEVREV